MFYSNLTLFDFLCFLPSCNFRCRPPFVSDRWKSITFSFSLGSFEFYFVRVAPCVRVIAWLLLTNCVAVLFSAELIFQQSRLISASIVCFYIALCCDFIYPCFRALCLFLNLTLILIRRLPKIIFKWGENWMANLKIRLWKTSSVI